MKEGQKMRTGLNCGRSSYEVHKYVSARYVKNCVLILNPEVPSTFSPARSGTFFSRSLICIKKVEYKGAGYFMGKILEARFCSQEGVPDQDIYGRFLSIISGTSQWQEKLACYSTPIDLATKPKTAISYNRLMDAHYRASDFDEVLKLWREMKQSTCKPNVFVCNTVLKSLVAADRLTSIDSFLNQMKALGIAPNISTYNILVKAYSCQSDQFHLANKVISYMVKNGPTPDVITYSTLISGLCRAGRILDAYNVFVSRWKNMWKGRCIVNVFTFTPILQALYDSGRVKEANHIFGCMLKGGILLNTVTYNILIDGLCKNRYLNKAKMLLENSAKMGWKPNSISYNSFIKGLCREGRVLKAFDIVEAMMKNGPYPTNVTLNILLDALCHAGHVYKALSVLENSSKLGWNVGILNYNIVMSGFCKTKGLKDEEILETVQKLFNEAKDKGIIPNCRTHNIVIQSLCKAGKPMVAKSMIENGGFLPNRVTYNILLNAFSMKGNDTQVQQDYDSQVQDLVERMEKEKIYKDIFTYTIEIRDLCKCDKCIEAIDVFLKYKKKGFAPDLVMYSALINGLAKHSSLSEVVYWLDKMLTEGLAANYFLLDSVIRAFCAKGYCQSEKIQSLCYILDNLLCKR